MGMASCGLLIMQVSLLLLLSVHHGSAARHTRGVQVLTFNADLTDAVSKKIVNGTDINDSRKTRRDALISSLRNAPADIICLQEVYFGPDLEAIVSGLSRQYRYSFSTLHQGGSLPQQNGTPRGPVCPTTLSDAVACLEFNKCTLLEELSAFQTCAAKNCGSFLATKVLPSGPKCAACVAFNLPDTLKVQDRCTSIGDPSDNLDINPSGLLMLSKRPLSNTGFLDFYEGTPTYFHRGYLQATIDRRITAVCSHLSSTLPPYTEPFVTAKIGFTSYAEQNRYEAQQIIDTFRNYKNIVIAVDLNSGLNFGLPSISERIPETYDAMHAMFRTIPVRECITCSDNTFRSPTINNTIDEHVFTGRGLRPIAAKRVLTRKFTFGTSQINYSDHFGAMVTVSYRAGRKRGNN